MHTGPPTLGLLRWWLLPLSWWTRWITHTIESSGSFGLPKQASGPFHFEWFVPCSNLITFWTTATLLMIYKASLVNPEGFSAERSALISVKFAASRESCSLAYWIFSLPWQWLLRKVIAFKAPVRCRSGYYFAPKSVIVWSDPIYRWRVVSYCLGDIVHIRRTFFFPFLPGR